MTLEPRHCKFCDKSFKVLPTSLQEYCSTNCKDLSGTDPVKGKHWRGYGKERKQPLQFDKDGKIKTPEALLPGVFCTKE